MEAKQQEQKEGRGVGGWRDREKLLNGKSENRRQKHHLTPFTSTASAALARLLAEVDHVTTLQTRALLHGTGDLGILKQAGGGKTKQLQ